MFNFFYICGIFRRSCTLIYAKNVPDTDGSTKIKSGSNIVLCYLNLFAENMACIYLICRSIDMFYPNLSCRACHKNKSSLPVI